MASRTRRMRWFVADLVVEIRVEGDARSDVNTVLVRARDLEHAYDAAMKIGHTQAWKPYLNPAGRKVDALCRTRFSK